MSKDSGSSCPDEGDPRRRFTGLSSSFSPPPLFTDEEIAEMSTGLTPEERKASINDAARVAVEKNMEAVREQHDYEMQLLRDQLAATLLASNVGVVPDVPSSDPSSKTVPSNPAPPPDQSSNPPIHSVSFSPLIDTPTAVRAVVSTFHDLLGDFPLPVERTDLELENSAMPVISKADRLRLTSSDKNKIYVSFSKGIPSKFKASSTIVGIDEVSTIDNIMSFDQLRLELQRHITSVSAHSVFLILRFNNDGTLIDPDTTAGAPVNILSSIVLSSLADIERSTFFHFKRGSLFNQENLVWTYKSIRNSCDKDLQTIIDAKMLKYKPIERFGPLYYYELFQQMTTVDSKAVRAITQELTSLKVPDHEGQSISKVAKYVRSTIIWLNMVSMLPPDIDAIVYDVLDTSTVPDFQLFLKTCPQTQASTASSLQCMTFSTRPNLTTGRLSYQNVGMQWVIKAPRFRDRLSGPRTHQREPRAGVASASMSSHHPGYTLPLPTANPT